LHVQLNAVDWFNFNMLFSKSDYLKNEIKNTCLSNSILIILFVPNFQLYRIIVVSEIKGSLMIIGQSMKTLLFLIN